MKKLLWFIPYILTLVLGFTNTVYADVCFYVAREGDPTLPVSEANALERDCTQNGNCKAWWDYDARTRALDITGIYSASLCKQTGPQNPSSSDIAVTVIGLDENVANQWAESWWEPTGEVDPDGYVHIYLKRDARFQIPRGNLPTPMQNIIDSSSYIIINWSDICGYVLNHASGLSGAECP